MSEQALAKEVVAHRLLLACQALAQNADALEEVADAMTEEGISAMRAELQNVATRLSTNPRFADTARRVLTWLAPVPAMGLPPVANALMSKAKKVTWEIHEDKETGKKCTWTAKWEGFKLRVVHAYEPGQGVIFVGYIDDMERPVIKGKMVGRVKAFVEEEALRKLSARPPKP